MKIELKNIQHSERLSQETNAFAADLYINGVKAGVTSNQGFGGPTDYHGTTAQGDKLIQEAEAYCKSLPPEKFDNGGEEISFDMNLEYFIDKLLEDHLAQKELKRFQKKMDKAQETGIIVGIPQQSYFVAVGCKMPVAVILVRPGGHAALADIIQRFAVPHIKEGQKILNTNIPEKVLKQAGLTAEQYLSAAQKPAKKPQKKKGRSM